MGKYDLVGSFVWLALAIFIAFESLRIGVGGFRSPDAGLFPFLNSILLAFFASTLMFDAIFRTKRKGERGKIVWPKSTNWKNLLSTLVALVLYACIIDKVGYLLTTFFFMLFLFRVVEPQKWIAATLGAVTTALLSYLIFEVWLQTQLPNGVLFAWLKKVL